LRNLGREDKRATSGILVTTAWVGPESKAFAIRNNRLRIIEGGDLKHLLAEHLNLNVRIDLAGRPRKASWSSGAVGATSNFLAGDTHFAAYAYVHDVVICPE